MMPMPYGSFSLQLIALTAGVALFIWSLNSHDKGAVLGRFFGFIIMILALLSVLCTLYMSIKFWTQPASSYEVVQISDQTTHPTMQDHHAAHKEKSTDKKK
jgi:hypothetical protein